MSLIDLLVSLLQALGIFAAVMLTVWVVDPDISSCRSFCSVPGPLQSVQGAEMWGVILALQSSRAVHLGVDNLGVVRHVGRLIDGCRGPVPFELVNDGDLLLFVD